MKKLLLALTAVAAMASCKKDNPTVQEDNRLLGEWVFTQVDHPTGVVTIVGDTWDFKESTIVTPDTVLNYTAKDYKLIIGGRDTFNYSFPTEGLNMLDKRGNNLRFTR